MGTLRLLHLTRLHVVCSDQPCHPSHVDLSCCSPLQEILGAASCDRHSLLQSPVSLLSPTFLCLDITHLGHNRALVLSPPQKVGKWSPTVTQHPLLSPHALASLSSSRNPAFFSISPLLLCHMVTDLVPTAHWGPNPSCLLQGCSSPSTSLALGSSKGPYLPSH